MTATGVTTTTQRTDALNAVVNAIHGYLPDAEVKPIDTGSGRIELTVRPAGRFTAFQAAALLQALCCTAPLDGSTPGCISGVCTRHHVAVWVTVHVSS